MVIQKSWWIFFYCFCFCWWLLDMPGCHLSSALFYSLSLRIGIYNDTLRVNMKTYISREDLFSVLAGPQGQSYSGITFWEVIYLFVCLFLMDFYFFFFSSIFVLFSPSAQCNFPYNSRWGWACISLCRE